MDERIGPTDEVGEIAADVVAIGNELRYRLLLGHELIGEPPLFACSLRSDGVGLLEIDVTASTLSYLHAQPLAS